MKEPAVGWWLVVWTIGEDDKYAIFDDRQWAQQFVYTALRGTNTANVYPCLSSTARGALKGLLA